MKGRLWVKLFLSFALVIIVSGALIMGIMTNRISGQFKVYVKNGDLVAARSLAPLLERYYDLNGSWDNVLDSFPVQMPAPGEKPRMVDGPAVRRMNENMNRRILITDFSNNVLVDSTGNSTGGVFKGDGRNDGIILRTGYKDVGKLYLGTMIHPEMNPLGEAFLVTIRKSVFIAVLPALILALGISLLIVRHITKPLVSMKLAAGKISGGDFTVRSEIVREDELGDLARAFDEMAVSLEEGEEWKRRIIADSAHELRTPVSLIQGSLEMMSDGVYPLDRERIRGLYEEALRLSELIAGLQDLAGLQSGNKGWVKTEVDMTELAREVADSFLPLLREKDGVLEVVKADIPPVLGNSGQLKQVFLNLFSNALRYIPRKGKITVEFEHNRPENDVKVSISNNGPSIPEGELEKIFERFYRLDRSRNSDEGGRGLGLAICSEIVKGHGGRIEARNLELNSGVMFAFYIPV